jgi:hypothetical protein
MKSDSMLSIRSRNLASTPRAWSTYRCLDSTLVQREENKRGKVGYSTYLILIALQCLGLPLALLISPSEKVIHGDGTKLEDPT